MKASRVWVSECTREINKKKEFSTRFLRSLNSYLVLEHFSARLFRRFIRLIRLSERGARFFFVCLHPVHYCFSWLYQKTDCRDTHHVAIDMLWNVQSAVVNDSKDQIKRHAVAHKNPLVSFIYFDLVHFWKHLHLIRCTHLDVIGPQL